MTTSRRECDDNLTTLSDPERILGDGRRTAPALSAAPAVCNLSIVPRSLQAALQTVATFLLRAQVEDTFEGIATGTALEERLSRVGRIAGLEILYTLRFIGRTGEYYSRVAWQY